MLRIGLKGNALGYRDLLLG